MKILCVEDGSIDVDNLPNMREWREDKVLVYRQGSKPPFVLEIEDFTLSKDKFVVKWNEIKDLVKTYSYQSDYCKEILDLMDRLENKDI